jgi:hypothetical protein
MMGSWFHTCLSQGGCNQMAVLANAYDANKQVVFMRDAKTGAALARQLLAFNQHFQLLGYHCYSVAPGDDEATRDKYIAAMARYAGTRPPTPPGRRAPPRAVVRNSRTTPPRTSVRRRS